MTTAAVTIKSMPCPECGKVYEAKSQGAAARTLGMHRSLAHGVRGKTHGYYLASKKKRKQLAFQVAERGGAPAVGVVPDKAARLKEYKRQWWANKRAGKAGKTTTRTMPLLMDPVSVARREYQTKLRAKHRAERAGNASEADALAEQRRANLDKAREARWAKHHATNGDGPAAAPPNPFPISFCPHCGKDIRAHIAAGNL